MSGVTVLGYPAEIYAHGIQFAGVALGAILASIAVILWYLPIFFRLQVTSSYEVRECKHLCAVSTTGNEWFAQMTSLPRTP